VRRAVAAFSASVAIGSSACGRSGDPVEALLERVEAAVEARDSGEVSALLSGEFETASGQSREEATRTLKRLFLGYESIGVERVATEIERGEGSAQVRCWVELDGRARPVGSLGGLLPPDATYRFDVGVVQTEAGWLVSRVGWERVQRQVD
jgi:hypothetical protein